ncbi:CCR4-NOT transcription complex subunit [Acrasis kona]|uniref:poly(A)-specific ribonuclease n=1 Tax=Acrasis kona TaxID=1008807 RepID=A0AAW2ZKV2_9EUKA
MSNKPLQSDRMRDRYKDVLPNDPRIRQMNITTLSTVGTPQLDELREKVKIVDVWASNLDEEMEVILSTLEKYPCIAMDTEFPGIVARPTGQFRSSSEHYYQTVRCNVNLLKIIQLGLTFSDENGNLPEDGRCSWQFNFKFNIQEDMYAQDSIELLTRSGIDFNTHQNDGIDVEYFGELLMSSGVVFNDNVKWISFHSAYDFAYLIKLLTCSPLPNVESEFFDLLHHFFPCIFDIKYLMKSCDTLKGGLNHLAEELNVTRIGPAHQAGSDSLLTAATFFKMMRVFFENNLSDPKYIGVLYGLGQGYDNAAISTAPNQGTPGTPTSSVISTTVVNAGREKEANDDGYSLSG